MFWDQPLMGTLRNRGDWGQDGERRVWMSHLVRKEQQPNIMEKGRFWEM